MNRATGPICLLAALMAAAISPALARGEWYDNYERARVAVEAGRHAEAVERLEMAMKRRPEPGTLRTYGNNYIRYAPNYWLGVAWHGAGECERALEWLDRAFESGEVSALPAESSRMGLLRADCRARLAPPPAETPAPGGGVPAAPAARPVPSRRAIEAIEHGLRSYLSGDFDEAIRRLDELSRAEPDSPVVRLLLGSALYNAWVLQGEEDEGLLERSRAELRAAARLDPGFEPDPRLFPPKVIALYEEVR